MAGQQKKPTDIIPASGFTKKGFPGVHPLGGWILLAAVLIRLGLSFLPSDAIDMPGYKAWSLTLATRGFRDLYQTWHVVYGPGYLYLLWLSGKIALAFPGLSHDFLIKFWMVLSDFAAGCLIYLIAAAKGAAAKGKPRLGFWLGIGYALNPAIIFNSSVWGQFESLAATLLVAVVYFFQSRRKGLACILYTVAILVKPQSAVLLPLVAILLCRDFHWRELIGAICGSAAAYLILVLPFSAGRPVDWILTHYLKSGGDYPYATANGFNLWTILGGQTRPDNLPFCGLSYLKWSLVLIVGVALLSLTILRFKIDAGFAGYYAAFILCCGVFCVGSRMHERYLYPALVFLTICLIWDFRLFVPLVGLSLCHLGNTWYIYIRAWQNQVWVPPDDPLALLIAWATMSFFAYAVYYLIRLGIHPNRIAGEPR